MSKSSSIKKISNYLKFSFMHVISALVNTRILGPYMPTPLVTILVILLYFLIPYELSYASLTIRLSGNI